MTDLLRVDNLSKRFGGLLASNALNLQVTQGETHALIGPNGAGKSTLMNQLSGEIAPSEGNIFFKGQNITSLPVYERTALGIARSYQLTTIFNGFSALENVMLAVQAHQGHSFHFWSSARKEQRLREPAAELLARVGLQERANVVAGGLAHGEQRQLELAMALASEPELLLLDEPLAGMGVEDSLQIIQLLEALKKDHTILLIEHDMNAIFSLADRVSVLVYGTVIATGSVDEIRANAEVQKAYLGTKQEGQRFQHA
ncbi:MAG TPA: ABC transporter ATP-binding protein [Eoetvoesiella sp.]|uniref:ABC transporter ATP-binding protein n=1 Tax=Eoetvoesiella sp. TaxID=1966355 RepID=UPI002B8A197C|nr:ABC transporter ATP-binding protein [Eoetvoesiella sp.]HWK63221.1 ABC transporter ATP-binding protein [Eoetvoesiella sp.]